MTVDNVESVPMQRTIEAPVTVLVRRYNRLLAQWNKAHCTTMHHRLAAFILSLAEERISADFFADLSDLRVTWAIEFARSVVGRNEPEYDPADVISVKLPIAS